MTKEQCSKCKYEPDCFPLLHLWQRINPAPCMQGRNRNRQSTLADITGDGTNAI